MSLLNQISTDLRRCKPYPTKIILGQSALNKIVEEVRQTGTIGLKVNLRGEYVRLWGLDIEIDYDNPERIEYINLKN